MRYQTRHTGVMLKSLSDSGGLTWLETSSSRSKALKRQKRRNQTENYVRKILAHTETVPFTSKA